MWISGDGDSACQLSISTILVFITGADSIPPLGFERQPTIVVDHDDVTGQYPRASTCDMRLIISVGLQGPYDRFCDKMAFAILNCHGFGRI